MEPEAGRLELGAAPDNSKTFPHFNFHLAFPLGGRWLSAARSDEGPAKRRNFMDNSPALCYDKDNRIKYGHLTQT